MAVHHEEHARWIRDVRDPATAAGRETVEHRRGQASGRYDIAQIPSGWAWRVEYAVDGYSGGIRPWTSSVTREEARLAAIDSIRRGFASHHALDVPAVVEVLALLEADQVQPSLFEEPTC